MTVHTEEWPEIAARLGEHDDEALRLQAIAAYKEMRRLGTIVIRATDRDFTPSGKRTARLVRTARGGLQYRWYVRGRIYHALSPTAENYELTLQWLAGGPG